MMRYLNRRTGAIIETNAVVAGGDWEAARNKLAAQTAPDKKPQAPQKKRSVKK